MQKTWQFSYTKVAIKQLLLLLIGIFFSFLLICSPVFAEATNNLEARYYDTDNRYTSFGGFSGSIIETRTWEQIDTSNYNPQGRGDRWSVAIDGYIYIPSDGTYFFETYSDDGVRLKIDENIVINNWTTHAPTINTGQVDLQSGWKPIQMEMFEWGGVTRLRLRWKPPGSSDYSFPPAANLSTTLPVIEQTPAEAFTEVEDDIGAKMKSNTTKQIRSFATATTAVVSSARGRVFSKRVSSSRSGGASRSSGGGTRSTGGGGGSDSSSGGGGSSSDGGASGGTDGGDNDNSNDGDTESSFDLRSSSRGTNASGKINGVLQSADGKLTRYTETQFSYTESENETETGSASSQVIFEREQSEDLTIGRFIGFSLSKNSTVDTNTTNIESVGLQVGSYFVRNMTEDLFVDGYVAASLLTNNMEVTTSSMTAEADYVSRMAATGLAITGSLSVDRWEILPTFGVDYSVVSSQDAEFEVTSGAGNSNELSSPGHVKQLSLSFSPDFRTSFDYYNGYWSQGSTFSVKPKVTCQRIDQDTIIEECGQGATVSVTSQDESQMKTLAFTLGIDTISNDTTYSANALYKVEF